MRLAVFTNEFPSPTSSFFARDIRGLIEAGVDVHVFPFYSPTPSLWSAVPALLDARVFPRDRIHYVPLSAAARLPRRSELGRLPVAMREALAATGSALRFGAEAPIKTAYVTLKAWAWAQRFPAGSFDHVLSYWGNYSATAAYLYHLLTDPRVPFSMFAHARMDLYEKQTYLAQKMTYADNLFLVCEYNRGYVRDLYPAAWPRLVEKIQIHHLGLDLEEFAFTPAGRARGRIVTVGRLERLKGVHCLLAAVALLRARGVTPEVEIVGGGEESEALASQARELGIEDRVIFRGWLRPDEVIAAMRAATILVHPSIRPDAMPTVLKEAIALGTPVIASDLAGIPEILDQGRCGLLTPAGDVASLAAAIERLLGDESQRMQNALRGRAHAEACFDMWPNGRRLAERLRSTPMRGAAPAGAAP